MNTKNILMLGLLGGALYWLWERSQKPAAAPSTGITSSGSNTWDISLPPVQAFPACPAGQYYDPYLQMCMTAPGAL